MPLGRARDRSRARAAGGAARDAIAALAPVERWRADGLAASPVASWASTGSAAHAATQGTGANQPTWAAASASFNSKPVVTYAAAQQLQAGTTADFRYLHDGTGCTVLVVARATTLGATQYVLDTQGNSTLQAGALVYLDSTNHPHFLVGQGAATALDLASTATVALNTGFVLVARFATAATPDGDLRLNRAQVATGNAGALTSGASATALSLNGWATPAFGLAGDVAEVVLWNSYLPDATVTGVVEPYVLARYSV